MKDSRSAVYSLRDGFHLPMKKLLLAVVGVLAFVQSEAQNLVPNWSFEDTLPNPAWMGFITYDCAIWQSPAPGSAKYDNDFDPFFPGAASYYQVPHTGAAWALIYTNTSAYGSPNFRDVLQAPLLDTLRAGKKYCISFYVSLFKRANYACNNIGALLSPTMVTNSNSIVTMTPTIDNDPIANPLLSDTSWIEVSGSFIANGGEQYIIIGNFHDDATSDTVYMGVRQQGNDFAEYLVDDVSVYECDDSFPPPDSTVFSIQIPNVFTPNGDNVNDRFEVNIEGAKNYHCEIFNRWGTQVFSTNDVTHSWDGKNSTGQPCSAGTYYYIIRATDEGGKEYVRKGFLTLIK